MSNRDFQRTDLRFEMYCQIHKDEKLTFSSDDSEISGSSAYNLTMKVRVHPCKACKAELDKVRDAIKLITNFKSDEK